MSIIISTMVKADAVIATGAETLGVVHVPTIANPFPGAPDFSVFGVAFDSWWKKLFAAVWALGMIVAGFYLVVGIVAMSKADANNPRAHQEGKDKAMGAGIGFVVLAGLGVIIGAILTLAGSSAAPEGPAAGLDLVPGIEMHVEG